MESKKAVFRRQTVADSSFLRRQITSLSLLSKTSTLEPAEDIRGPYGLTLLHEPDEPLIDFVFVHGLRGGSRKTWSKTQNPADFWPKEWLKQEPAFKNVRIHSYGYNSDWGERKGSILTVHDFGQALLADMFNSRDMGGPKGDSPIVLVGHSMGGIVIKKALLLAKQDPIYGTFASRIHSMFFLATPHRGSDSAQLLSNVLQLSGPSGAKSYVDNLIPNSEAIHTINDQFRHIYQDVQLWSFFETVKTSLGLIVEKGSAILGLPGERIQLLNADHRHVCKFTDPSDSNYQTLRNAFVSAIMSIEHTWFSTRRDEHQTDMKVLSAYLGHADKPEADLAAILDQQTDGSCEWLTAKDAFHDWREGVLDAPKYMWLQGNPATGKSTLAGHVINYLASSTNDCSFFFFKQGIASKSTIPHMLCSIAWQMAYSNTTIRRKLLAMQDEGVHIDLNDSSTLWRTLFMTRIFKTELRQPHFWVIDALDECKNNSTLCSILAKVDKEFRLKVLLTSRPSPTIERLFAQEKVSLSIESTALETSLQDIQLFLNAHKGFLPVPSDAERNDLAAQILRKSNGNFLWTSLVVKELEETISTESIDRVLGSVPKELDDYYARILKNITNGNKNANTAKAILRWTLCASRPLTVDELREALFLDIGETLPQLDKNAGAICGNLIRVDNKLRVQPTHQTVKEFLFEDRTGVEGEYRFDQLREHARIADICLAYLCGDDLKMIRYRRSSVTTRNIQRSVFLDYAATHFATHIAKTSASDDNHLTLLNKFFMTNSLTWIEILAAKNDLNPVTETAKNIKSFMERRAKYRSPLGKEYQNVLDWTDDLIRLVAQFGRAILCLPSSIHFMIPSVCPSKSITARTYANYPRPLRLVGLSQTTWDDRLSCLVYTSRQALSISCCDNIFAVGLSDKTLRLYQEKAFHEQLKLDLQEPVRASVFNAPGTKILAAGRKKVRLWDLTSASVVWTASVPDQLLALSFSEDDSAVIGVTRANQMIFWNTATGLETKTAFICDYSPHEMAPHHTKRPPIHADFSPGLGLLGVAYRNRPLNFWDIETDQFVGHYPTEIDAGFGHIYAFMFNPIPEICLAVVAFQDGDIAVFEPWSGATHATAHADVSCLATSPNGTILATGDLEGVIKLFDFETLKLLYQINSHEENIRSLAFSPTGLRFYDVRGDHCNVWEPSVLVRRGISSDDSSVDVSERVLDDAQTITARTFNDDHTITSLVAHHDGDLVFCGFEDGTVAPYTVTDGMRTSSTIRESNFLAVAHLQWNESRSYLALVDRTGHVTVHVISKVSRSEGFLKSTKVVVDFQAIDVVQQVLFSPDGCRLLVSTGAEDQVWNLDTGTALEHAYTAEERISWRWISATPATTSLVYFEGIDNIKVFEWANFGCTKAIIATLPPPGINAVPFAITQLVSSFQGHATYSVLGDSTESTDIKAIYVYRSPALHSDDQTITPSQVPEVLVSFIKSIIGTWKSNLVFLSRDDWICSVNIDMFEKTYTISRHFYIPLQWHGTVGKVPMVITKKGCVVMARQDELAVFQGGMEFEEKVSLKLPTTNKLVDRPATRRNTSSPAAMASAS